ncbi:hypothetical protein H7Y63_01915 [Polaromonas sp.]|nr:hypothetical protein [Candidatus Saccharibacteria bacterium]
MESKPVQLVLLPTATHQYWADKGEQQVQQAPTPTGPPPTTYEKTLWLKAINDIETIAIPCGKFEVVGNANYFVAVSERLAWNEFQTQPHVAKVEDDHQLGLFDQFTPNIDEYLKHNPEISMWLGNYAALNDITIAELLITPLNAIELAVNRVNHRRHINNLHVNLRELRLFKYVGITNPDEVNDSAFKRLPADTITEEVSESQSLRTYQRYHAPLSTLAGKQRQEAISLALNKAVNYYKMIDSFGIRGFKPELLFRPPHEYAQILGNHPRVASQIYHYAVNNPCHDYKKLRGVALQLESLKYQVESTIMRPDESVVDSQLLLDKNSEELEALINDARLNPTVATLRFGETAVVKGDGDNRMLKKADVGSLIESHLKLAAHRLRIADETLTTGKMPYLWAYWNKVKITGIADKLVGKFNGNVMDLRFTALPVDKAYFDQLVNDDVSIIATDEAVRFAVAIDLKSSGKKPITNLIDVVLYKRISKERGPSIVLSVRGRSKNEDPIEFLHLEAVLNGVALEIAALRHTFSAGGGSLGKRS